MSNDLFNVIFLNLKKQKENKYFLKMIKSCIRLSCINKAEHEEIFIKIKNDKNMLNDMLNSKFSGTSIVWMINKIMSMEIEINKNIINLIFSLVSGLQTIESCMMHIDDNNKSLTTVMHSYMMSANTILINLENRHKDRKSVV